jgi:tetratricopeptide (TPR) repeat protein
VTEKRLLLGLLLVAALTGCETETRMVDFRAGGDPFQPIDPDTKRVSRKETFLARVEKDPKDAQGWFQLGQYCEEGLELVEAANAYEKGAALLEPGRYTGGHYLLARVYLRLQEWERSVANLNALFALEPKDVKTACLNGHFREAHYLRGAIHHILRQFKDAKKEFLRFLELGGEEWRVEDSLEEIRAQGE